MKDNYVGICTYATSDKFTVLYNFNDNKIYFIETSKYTIKKLESKYKYITYASTVIGLPIVSGLIKVFDNIYPNNIFNNIVLIILIALFCLMFSEKIYKSSKSYDTKRVYIGLTNEELEEHVKYGKTQFKKQILLIISGLILLLMLILLFIFYGSGFLLILNTFFMIAFFLLLISSGMIKRTKFFKMYEKGEIKI